MDISLPRAQLTSYVTEQVNNIFPDPYKISERDLTAGTETALDRIEYCFGFAKKNRYFSKNHARFDHLYSDQYIIFLWMLSNSLYKQGSNENILNKIYYLNKTLHSFDCIYNNSLPDIFMIIHGVGTVLGNARYSNFFVAYQGCTVGQNHGKYPEIGLGVGLGAGASVLGETELGNHVSLSSGVTVIDRIIDEGSVVFRGDHGELLMKPAKSQSISRDYFNF